ncbi:MAG: hypothetical protein H0T51_10790 [Pirellulales bacterium]|nr:hypothetical protein [Pirellulales bacterium]
MLKVNVGLSRKLSRDYNSHGFSVNSICRRGAEIDADYETNTGEIIVERFATIDPIAVPAVLVAGHGKQSCRKNSMN